MLRKKQAAVLRTTRKIHQKVGVLLFLFLMIIGITGILLGWKKNVDIIQRPTALGATTNMTEWLPLDSLLSLAHNEMIERKGKDLSLKINKLDVRPDKGIVKVIYEDHFYSVQVDAANGHILSFEHRTADLIEQIHEGTWVDNFLGLPGGVFKLFYTTVTGLALIVFTITGFWLWYGPKRMRSAKKAE